MAPHSSTLAWKIPWMEETGRLQSMGLLRVGHDRVTSISLFTFHFHALEKEMATHFNVLAWRIPGTGEPGGLPSMGSHRVGHDWSDLAAAAAMVKKVSESHSVVSDSLWPHGLYSPWNSPGQYTWVGSLSLLQGIFPAQGLNPGLPYCRQILYQLSHKGSCPNGYYKNELILKKCCNHTKCYEGYKGNLNRCNFFQGEYRNRERKIWYRCCLDSDIVIKEVQNFSNPGHGN